MASFTDLQELLSRSSSILVVEPNKIDVCLPRKRIVHPKNKWPEVEGTLTTTTLGNAMTRLAIREWDFYTALMKTELAYSLLDDDPISRSLGAYLQHRGLLKWNPNGLRITQSGVFSRKDSARTSLAGRFGEALMYLYMVQIGYPFWDHLPSLVERAMENQGYSRDDKLKLAKAFSRPAKRNGKQVREPDYAFENVTQEVALAEAKGAFVNPGEAPSMVKNGLADGIDQTELWRKHISPTPKRCFAIGSYLREENDSYDDPSVIAVIDPDDDTQNMRSVDLPPDWVRRGNYAAWLRGMGLLQSAESLSFGRTNELPIRDFLTISLAGREYAITPTRWWPSCQFPRLLEIDEQSYYPFFPLDDLQIMGIEVNNLSLIEKALKDKNTFLPSNMAIQIVTDKPLPNWFSGSIMPDGSLNGILHYERERIRFGKRGFRV